MKIILPKKTLAELGVPTPPLMEKNPLSKRVPFLLHNKIKSSYFARNVSCLQHQKKVFCGRMLFVGRALLLQKPAINTWVSTQSSSKCLFLSLITNSDGLPRHNFDHVPLARSLPIYESSLGLIVLFCLFVTVWRRLIEPGSSSHTSQRGRVTLPNRMNFRKGSKRQLTPT